MFGANPIRKQELRNDGMLWVQEVFRTIQGEGPLAGRPAVFIRLAGCNLACKFCDTEFESGEMRDEQLVAAEAFALAQGWSQPLFVLTGGEPFRQNIRELATLLLKAGDVQVETAGTLALDKFDERVQVVVSPKTGKLNDWAYIRADAFKYIIRAGQVDEADGLPNVMPTGIPGKVARPNSGVPVYVQPCDDHQLMSNLANLAEAKQVALRFGYRLSLQQHKILELP